MEINLNTKGASFGNLSGIAANDAAGAVGKKGDSLSGHLTVTEAVASPEDIQAATIPEAALARDDALGKLAEKAFNLPPPPMPHFE